MGPPPHQRPPPCQRTLAPLPLRERPARRPRHRAQQPGRPQLPLRLPGPAPGPGSRSGRSEEHTSELQSLRHLVCRLLLEKKKKKKKIKKKKIKRQTTDSEKIS